MGRGTLFGVSLTSEGLNQIELDAYIPVDK